MSVTTDCVNPGNSKIVIWALPISPTPTVRNSYVLSSLPALLAGASVSHDTVSTTTGHAIRVFNSSLQEVITMVEAISYPSPTLSAISQETVLQLGVQFDPDFDPEWISNLSSVQVHNTSGTYTIASPDLTISSGQILIDTTNYSALHGTDTCSITVNATTYTPAVLSSIIPLPGPAVNYTMQTQPQPAAHNTIASLFVPQPVLHVTDVYGNGVSITTSVTITKTGGFTLGGPVTISSATYPNGVITISGLTAQVSGSPASGCTLSFALGLHTILSAPFNVIP